MYIGRPLMSVRQKLITPGSQNIGLDLSFAVFEMYMMTLVYWMPFPLLFYLIRFLRERERESVCAWYLYSFPLCCCSPSIFLEHLLWIRCLTGQQRLKELLGKQRHKDSKCGTSGYGSLNKLEHSV